MVAEIATVAPCLTSVPHNPDDPAHKCCLSVVGEKRALDVEFDTPVQRDEWLLLLEWWIEQTKAEAEDSRLGVPAPLSGGSSRESHGTAEPGTGSLAVRTDL